MKTTANSFTRIWMLSLLLIAGVLTATAADFTVDCIGYNIIGDNEVEVTKPDSANYSGEVFIPATVVNDGITYQVTRIGRSAFSSCKELTLVGIPEGVTEIGDWAFSYCSKLENIDLPNSLISIGKGAFMSCMGFTSFSIPRNLASIEYNALTYLTNVEYFTCSSLNNHFKAVGGVLYSKDLTRLVAYPPADPATSFDIPGTVTVLGDYCFCSCSNLINVNIPESVTLMGMNIFRACSGLVEVDIPDGVTHMGVTVFGSCSSLTRVHLPASLDTIKDSFFSGCHQLTEVTIPRNVRCIEEQGFINAQGLKTVIIEEGSRLNSIGDYGFRDCKSLESLDMPNTVTSVGMGCFTDCYALKNIHMSENLTEVGSAIFWNCFALTEGAIIGDVPVIHNIFFNCRALKKLQFGSKNNTPGTTLVKNCAVANCLQVECIELGANIDSLESDALSQIDSLKVLICWAPTPPRCNIQWHSFFPIPSKLNAVLYVPKESLEAYRTTDEWKDFKTIAAIEDVGDMNGDGNISVSDVPSLINMLLAGGATNLSAPLADINLDGRITVGDVAALINTLLSSK